MIMEIQYVCTQMSTFNSFRNVQKIFFEKINNI